MAPMLAEPRRPAAQRSEKIGRQAKPAKREPALTEKSDRAQVVRQLARVRDAETRPVHLMDVRAAAAWLGLSKSTLDKMRCYGVGPRFIRATGRAVRYDPADLAAFAEGRRQERTTDATPA
jgi:predicted DNA-binding transcriptional regulator AlpA